MIELAIAAQALVPVLIWGKPGVGKSSWVMAFGRALKMIVEVVIASIREPSDFSGLPVIQHHADESEQMVRFAPPGWARRLAKAGKGILFLDEISTAAPAVQSALLRVVLDRTVADEELPEEIIVIAAANPPDMAASGWDLSAPLANRFCHLEWKVNSATWIQGMVQGWPEPQFPLLPSNWKEGIPEARALVASYIQHQPHNLLVLPDTDGAAGKAWASPRSWEMAARLMAACKSVGAGEDVTINLVSGCVGNGIGLEFYIWQKSLNLPDPEALLANPQSLNMTGRPGDEQFAILNGVMARTLAELTNPRWLACWSVLDRATLQGYGDVAAVIAKTLVHARRSDLALPTQQARNLIPLLNAAGIMQGTGLRR